LLYSDIQKKLILLLFIDCLFSHTSCSVTDADLMQLSQIQEVKDLDLSNTQITDTGVIHLSQVQELTYLI